MKRRYLTTPLYYVNARPHLGHAYTTLLADVVKRHYRQRGEGVTLLTGTDEHGEKIAQMAGQQGKEPQVFVDEVSEDFKTTWQKMGLEFDVFYRTTAPSHVKAVQKALSLLKEKGEIEFREYEGKYCVGCERFLTDSELTSEGKCPDHLKTPEARKEGNYFFKMSLYQNDLIRYFESHPESIRPDHFRNEVLSFLRKEPLTDLCISRPKTRLTWGIEIPFDSKFVTYVWFDALLNYLVATGWPEKFDAELWGSVTHFLAKDIVKTHSVYWGAMLMALGVAPARSLNVSGYWLVGGTKMSKSLGNVIRPLEVEAQYGLETLRFYLLREMSYGLDATFTLEAFVNAINAYLANGIGNLASRVLTLCQKNLAEPVSNLVFESADQELLAKRSDLLAAWDRSFEELKFQNALKAWSDLVTACDLYINDQKPWALAKDPAQKARLTTVLGTCVLVLRTLAAVIYPVLPQASEKLARSVGLDLSEAGVDLKIISETNLHAWKAPLEVPKLFMRVSLPVEAPSES